MNFLWITTLVCLSACVAQSQEMQKEKRGRRLCGNHLAEALSLVCEGSYNVQFGKRDGTELQQEPQDFEQLSSSSLVWSFLTPQAANSLLQKDGYPRRFRRQTRGVVDECCYKSCDYYTLRSYCAPKKPKV